MNGFARMAFAAVCSASLLIACGGGSNSPGGLAAAPPADAGTPSDAGNNGGDVNNPVPITRTTKIEPGPNATDEAVLAFVNALPGDLIEFGCGYFDISQTLLLSNTEGVTVRGCGVDETVLSFRNSNTPEGILMDNVRGVLVEDLTVADSDGNGFELRSVDHGTLRRVRAFWSSGGGRESDDPIAADNFDDGRLHVACTDPAFLNPNVPENSGNPDATSDDYTVSDKAGRYGIYPVKSRNILVEFAESVGASDAGIYVGQSSNSIIRKSRAVYNVFGFEIENVRGGEYEGNIAECNTGGFLIYDLDGLTQYGERIRMYDNISRNNNTYNFTEGGIVSQIPPGTGMLTLAFDRIDVFDNQFIDNNFGGYIHISYELLPEGAGRPNDRKIDFYTEGARVFNNSFRNNGNRLPVATTSDLEEQNVAKLLPALIGFKTQAACNNPANAGACPTDSTGGFRSANIVYDGLLDDYDETCPYPVDENGNPVPADANGKPIHTNAHPNPDCRYNKYKFDTTQAGNPRKQPLYWTACIEANNSFDDASLKFTNFKGTKGAGAALVLASSDPTAALTPSSFTEVQDFPADLDISPHDCDARFNTQLPLLEPIVIPAFVPSGDFSPAPTAERIAELCNASVSAGTVNFAAGEVNCPRLDQYNLFANPQDPTSTPNSSGVPFVLNTKLFSDYSVKYRVAYLPPNTQATYRDNDGAGANATIVYPVGSIIAKTFSFLKGGAETAIETRLLIKREQPNGFIRWDGLPYIWSTDSSGNKVATLQRGGGTRSVEWDYNDVDSGVRHTGSTTAYSVPTAAQCLSCHANKDNEEGSAPIGPKVRNLNRPYASESTVVTGQSEHVIKGRNQIEFLCSTGRMVGCPSDLGLDATSKIATNLERIPHFNVPGDSGFTANSAEDVEARARAWLETNCAHCHNDRGFADNTGFYVDVFRAVDMNHGICKGPTATGADGSGGRAVDIHPGQAALSILEFRISPQATSPSARMPPIARSVVDTEAHALITQWINEVITADETKYPGSTSCTQ